jgi:hypothetical protein
MQKHLNRLTLFLDTNFLFNILDIDEHNYYLEISKEIVYSGWSIRVHDKLSTQMVSFACNRAAISS